MSEAIDDGGHAFPQTAVYDASREMVNEAGAYGVATGMTLRDYFAAKALTAILGNLKQWEYWCTEYSLEEAMDFASDKAYKQADSMLRARKT